MADYRSVAKAAEALRAGPAGTKYADRLAGRMQADDIPPHQKVDVTGQSDGNGISKPFVTPGRVLRLNGNMAQQDEQDEQAEQDVAPAREQQAFVQPAIVRGTFQLHLATDILAVLISTVPLFVVAAWCYRTKPWKR